MWQRARNWSYTVQLALEEGFLANGITVVTVPSIHEIPSDSKASFLSHIADICKIMHFDQVWIELVHNNINDDLLSFLAKTIPVRVGIVAESMQYDPDAYQYAPELLQRRSQVIHRLQFMTHALVVDEADEADINASSSIKALWWPQSVPSQFIIDRLPPPKMQQATFGGEIYGSRGKWLDSPLLRNLLIKLPSAEQGTDLPQQFDHLNVLMADILLKSQRLDVKLLSKYTESLRTIRQQSFRLWLLSLQTGNAVVNLPSFFQGYAGRVFEGMAAGRTVISWHVSSRPRTCALFTDQQEILLFPKERPDVLAESIRHIQKNPESGSCIAENACSKIRQLHTTEIRVRQILEWIESGIYPEYSPAMEKTVTTAFVPQEHFTIFPESRHAHAWLDGLSGLEIGPSTHNPFGLTTRNVGMQDLTYHNEQLRLTGAVAQLHIEARADNIPLPDESEDFILSSHVIEHCPNLIKTLLEWFRIIKKNGLIYMIVPQRDAAPSDVGRPLTDWQHVYEDFITQADEYSEPESGRFGHCHYHVFDTLSMRGFIEQIFGTRLTLVDQLERDDKLGNGFTLVYRKAVSNNELEHWQYWERFRGYRPPVVSGTANNKFVNIGMVTYNRLEFTRQSLDALLLNTNFPYVLTIVDNASTDGTREYLKEQKHRGIIKNLVLLDENVGVAKASNLAWSVEPEADFYLKLDNDIVIQKPGWLGMIVDVVMAIPEAGAVAYNFEPVSYPEYEVHGIQVRPKNGNLGGACVLIPRNIHQLLGFWCEDYGLYGEEDADYGYRIMQAGLFNVYMHDEQVGIHLPSGRAAVIDPLTLLSSGGGEEDWYKEYRVWKDMLRRRNVQSGPFPGNLEKYMQTGGAVYLESAFLKEWEESTPSAPSATETAITRTVSIIIPAFNQAALTRKCLGALLTDLHEDAEIIVIDNGSTDWSPEYLASLGSKIRVTSNSTNLGFARACNQGAAIATGRYLVFLNNDTVPQPGWLDALIAPALEGKAEIVGARLLYPDGTIQHAGVVFDEQGPLHCFKRTPADTFEANQPRHLQAVTAACMLLTAKLFQELGGFDEGYKNGFEDIDLCLNAVQHGYRVFYQPESILIHHEESSPGRKLHDEENYERFLRRWHGHWQIDHQPCKPQISVIIPVFNQLAYTRKCLEALFLTTLKWTDRIEIIVVDNGSEDGTGEYLKTLEPRIHVLSHQENIGFAKGCNSGAQVAQGRYLVFLNNDTEPCSGWLEALLSVFESYRNIGIVGSKLLFPDGTIQHAGVAIVRDPYSATELSPCHVSYQQPDSPEHNHIREYQAVTAACCMMERSLFAQISGFDEGYWNGFEDVDLCFKALQAGYKVIYQPASVVIHHESKSGSERKRTEMRNLNRLQERWVGKIAPEYVRISPERVERIVPNE